MAEPRPLHTKTSLKSRLMCILNNARHAQYFPVRFSPAEPVWVLGTVYTRRPLALPPTSAAAAAAPEDPFDELVAAEDCPHLEEAMEDIQSRLWFTYREGFECIHNSKFTTDVGWGCMLRSGQMLLAHAMVLHVLGRGWRTHTSNEQQELFHRQILKLFDDKFANHCPFSLHHLLRHVDQEGVAPGTWLAPSTVCRALCRAIAERPSVMEYFPPIRAYMAADCLVSKSDMRQLASDGELGFVALLVLVPLRLGIHDVNPVYIPRLQNLLTDSRCLGIIGGRPRHSLYFIGFQGKQLIALDPHFCRHAQDLTNPSIPVNSYHCTAPRKALFSAIDPTLALGFYCQTGADLEHFFRLADEISKDPAPLFTCAP